VLLKAAATAVVGAVVLVGNTLIEVAVAADGSQVVVSSPRDADVGLLPGGEKVLHLDLHSRFLLLMYTCAV